MAGAVGFEPTNAGSKSRCLTERRKKNVGIAWLIFLEFSKPGARVRPMCVQNLLLTREILKGIIKRIAFSDLPFVF